MIRPIYVQHNTLPPEHVTYGRNESEAVLAIGDYRLPVPANDLTEVKDAVALLRRIAMEAEKGCRDLMARAQFLEQQRQHHAMALAAQSQQTPAVEERPCTCGMPADTRLVHRTDTPCYVREDLAPCPTCQGNGCPSCAGHGLAIVNTAAEAPAEQTSHLRPVRDDDPNPTGRIEKVHAGVDPYGRTDSRHPASSPIN